MIACTNTTSPEGVNYRHSTVVTLVGPLSVSESSLLLLLRNRMQCHHNRPVPCLLAVTLTLLVSQLLLAATMHANRQPMQCTASAG